MISKVVVKYFETSFKIFHYEDNILIDTYTINSVYTHTPKQYYGNLYYNPEATNPPDYSLITYYWSNGTYADYQDYSPPPLPDDIVFLFDYKIDLLVASFPPDDFKYKYTTGYGVVHYIAEFINDAQYRLYIERFAYQSDVYLDFFPISDCCELDFNPILSRL
jgi:hypothetical protein